MPVPIEQNRWDLALFWKFRRTSRSLESVGFRILDFSARSLVTIPTTLTSPGPHYFVSVSKPKAPCSTLYVVFVTAGLTHKQKVTGIIGVFQNLMFMWPCIILVQRCKQPTRCNNFFSLLIFLIQPYMFRATNSPILRSTFRLHIQLLVQYTDTAADRCHV